MSRENDTNPEQQISTDRDTIRAWGDEHGMVPVRDTESDESTIDVVPESERRGTHEELTWDDFGQEIDDQGHVVVREGDQNPDIGVYDRSEIIGQATVESDAVSDELLESETVETEVAERRVVEHTVVEEATVQSEIVDREIIETDTVDVELLTTDVDHVTVSRAEDVDQSSEAVTRFEPGTRLDEAYDVEFEIDEGWTLTKELLERITIESRVVETDMHDTETVQSDTVEETMDIDGIQETVLEGELVGSPQAAADVVETGHVESQFREDDVIETHVLRRKTVEEEMSVRKEFTGEVSDGETMTADAISHMVVESEIVGEDEYDVDMFDRATTETTTTGTETTATGTETTATGTETTATGTSGPATTEGTATTDSPAAPTDDEEGKTVVNSEGEEIGMVVDVEDGTMYVDPHASLTDRIRTALGWGDRDEDTYPVDNDQVARIEDDRVVMGVDDHR